MRESLCVDSQLCQKTVGMYRFWPTCNLLTAHYRMDSLVRFQIGKMLFVMISNTFCNRPKCPSKHISNQVTFLWQKPFKVLETSVHRDAGRQIICHFLVLVQFRFQNSSLSQHMSRWNWAGTQEIENSVTQPWLIKGPWSLVLFLGFNLTEMNSVLTGMPVDD